MSIKNQSSGQYNRMKTNIKRQKSLIHWLQDKLAVSEYGAKGFLRGMLWTALQNITLMLPVMLVYLMIEWLFTDQLMERLWLFIGLGLLSLIVMYIVALRQYDSTFPTVYRESGAMRIRLAEQLRRLPLSFFNKKNASDLTNILLGDVGFLENCYSHQLPQLAGSLVTLILVATGLLFMDWRLAIALFWAVPVVILILALVLKWQKRIFTKVNRQQLQMNEKMEEGITQTPTIKAYREEQRYIGELTEVLQDYEKRQAKTELATGIVVNGLEAIIRLTIPTLIITGISLYTQGTLPLTTLLFFVLISVTAYAPLSATMTNGLVFLYASVRIDRLNEVYSYQTMEGSSEVRTTSFDLHFQDVSFAYQDGQQVLHNVNFTAHQGEVTALIGPSGGGKSTTARLASRFWDPTAGSVYLGDIDISTIDPESLLQHYSIVFQDVVLFNNTVMENIRIGRKDATDEEVLTAARLAQCDSFVSQLPQGYHTMIGENGGRLSGGERQRISIARAILKDAPIVILDEATASQDAENETLIQQAISRLTQGKTVLVIAHRMRTIREADKIVVLADGMVAEEGTPQALYEDTSSHYHQMCRLQNR